MTKPVGVYDSNWDHRSDVDRREADADSAYLDARERIAKRDYFERFYDAIAFIEAHDLKAEFDLWLIDLYVKGGP